MSETHLLRRYPENPILTAADFPRHVNSAFNAAAVKFNGQYLLLTRVEDLTGSSCLWLARSDAGVHFTPTRHGFEIPAGGSVDLSAFRMLRNVTVRLRGGDEMLARRFEAGLERELSAVRVEAAPMAVAMLLVAVAMMVTPLTLVAHRADEIVRLLTDLLP